ncbi:hypothetical protein [Nonomuraea jabiensis]|uniref:Uncharacterized protein n=1 Tax=Nonomuraea jabiensis TaxID=882448 RepID=A0A7W9LDY6_9ACTN|nr:hypothetical protein [Nonomuraea jabiensis]MBB5780254.1 hypothetical protein [Nonomuraea jabiensis]
MREKRDHERPEFEEGRWREVARCQVVRWRVIAAGETGVDATKGGRADVIAPSVGQVTAADETVTAARRTLGLVGAPLFGNAPVPDLNAVLPEQGRDRPGPQRCAAGAGT